MLSTLPAQADENAVTAASISALGTNFNIQSKKTLQEKKSRGFSVQHANQASHARVCASAAESRGTPTPAKFQPSP